jgi:hypothetical protein
MGHSMMPITKGKKKLWGSALLINMSHTILSVSEPWEDSKQFIYWSILKGCLSPLKLWLEKIHDNVRVLDNHVKGRDVQSCTTC